MTRYEAMLTNRARVWAAFCHAARGDRRVCSAQLRRGSLEDPEVQADVLRLLDRLLAVGLIELAEMAEDGPVWRVTDRGVRDAERTLRCEARVPACVMADPEDWRHRAWTSARIHGTFTAADLQATAQAPSTDAIRRWLNELVDDGHVREAGWRDIAGVRWKAFRLVSRSVDAPRAGRAPTSEERDRRIGWRRRCWAACRRLGEAGGGFTSVEVGVAAGVSERRVQRLLDDLVSCGAVAKGGRTGAGPRGGRLWLYGLLPDAEEAARRAVERNPWRQRAWEILLDAEAPVIAPELAEAVGVTEATAKSFLDALVLEGWAVSGVVPAPDVKGCDPVGFSVSDGSPEACPKVPGRWKLRRLLAEAEAADG